MMGENPSYWWSLNGKLQPPPPSQQANYNNNPTNFLSTPSLPLPLPQSVPPASSLNYHPYLFGSSLVVPAAAAAANPNALADHHHQYHQDFPVSWSQLLLSGIAANDQEHNLGGGQQVKHGYEESSRQLVYNNYNNINNKNDNHDINNNEEDHLEAAAACSSSWSASQLINNPVPSVGSSSTSCMSLSTTTTTNYMFDFSNVDSRNQHTNQYSSQYDDTSTSGSGSGSGASKKPRTFQSHSTSFTQPAAPSMAAGNHDTFISGTSKRARAQNSSSTQTPLKVRKEKLGDRISALHQLVSPFGKTDTASVLLEATAQIRFLEGQIQALCSPYMNLGNNVSAGSCTRHRHSAADGKAAEQVDQLGSRGLCLVPVSCLDDIDTTNMTSNGAEFWTPALGGGF